MWWGKRVSNSTGGDELQKTADVPAECAPQFRLEPLEPRLLLSADPISAELARVVQEDALQNNADAVAAIIQEADSISETNAADIGQDEFLVKWPETWALSSDDTSSGQFDLQGIVAELVADARQAMQAGADLEGLVIGIHSGGEDSQDSAQSESAGAEANNSQRPDNANGSLTQALLDVALADALQGEDSSPFGSLGIQLAEDAKRQPLEARFLIGGDECPGDACKEHGCLSGLSCRLVGPAEREHHVDIERKVRAGDRCEAHGGSRVEEPDDGPQS